MLNPRHYQLEAVDAVFDYWSEEDGNPLVDLATGCHAAGTKVLMHDGSTKTVELVAVNDNLMGPDSQPRRVLRTVSGTEMMYRVTPTKGEPFIVNEGHILSLKATNVGKKAIKYPNSHQKGGEVVNITVRDYLLKTKSWKHIHKLWRAGVEFGGAANDNLPIPAYIVGVMLGDGSTTHQPGLTNMDPEVLDAVCDYVESIGVRTRVQQKQGNRAWSVFFPDDLSNRSVRNRFTQKLADAGLWGVACADKAIPAAYKTACRRDRLELLAGLLDTDGHLSSGSHFDFISKSEALSRDVTFVARSLGLAAYLKPCEKFCQTGGGGTYWRVSISGDVEMIPTRVARQKASARKQIKNPLVTGFKVEPVGEGDYYGFALDGDHLYLTDDFTVHHNTGKSLSMTMLMQRLVEGWPDMRICCVTHVAELIEQNYMELIGAWPFAPAGIYSAGIGRRDAKAQILFAGIQTVWNKVDRIGHVDVLMVDECHLIPSNANTMYGKFITALRDVNPDMKIVGLTATPYRLDSGRLDEGDDRLFDRVVYTYSIADGIRDGYLAPLSSKPTATGFDLTGVGRVAGEYNLKKLQAAVDKDEVTAAAVQEIVAKGADRRSWLVFCAGVGHALHVRDEIRSHGITCETVTGDTPANERRAILEAYKNYEVRALTNNSVLTTGFNHKGVDLIAGMRSTLSLSLYIQMMGRGTRPLYAPGMPLDTVEQRLAAMASGPKPNCLVLDFAGLVRKHGPVDMVEPKRPGKGEGEAPVKQCPECEELVHASLRVCSCCGFEFPPSEEPKHAASADIAPILSTAEAVWHDVTGRNFAHHEAKQEGKPPTVKVTYRLGMRTQSEWLCPQHTGYPKVKSDRFWREHGGAMPFPKSVADFLNRAGELAITAAIQMKPSGKYQEVVGWQAGAARPEAGTMVAGNDNMPAALAAGDDWQRPAWLATDLEDEIPF